MRALCTVTLGDKWINLKEAACILRSEPQKNKKLKFNKKIITEVDQRSGRSGSTLHSDNKFIMQVVYNMST